jgi:PRC-barrel domain
MTTYYEFRSEKDPELRGLTDDPAGEKLPADDRPWTLVRQVASEESWNLGFSKAASIAGVAENGFFLWDKKAFDKPPSSRSVIESDRVEGTAVYDPQGNHIGTIKRLIIEKVSGRVLYVDITFGGFLGLGTHHHTIPWEKLAYKPSLGGYSTDVTEEQVRGTPPLYGDAEVWPERRRDKGMQEYWRIPPNIGVS